MIDAPSALETDGPQRRSHTRHVSLSAIILQPLNVRRERIGIGVRDGSRGIVDQ